MPNGWREAYRAARAAEAAAWPQGVRADLRVRGRRRGAGGVLRVSPLTIEEVVDAAATALLGPLRDVVVDVADLLDRARFESPEDEEAARQHVAQLRDWSAAFDTAPR